jgi:hypothetical protein
MDVLGFGERGEGAGRRVRVRAKREDEILRQSWISRADRTLTPTPLPRSSKQGHPWPFPASGGRGAIQV